MTGSFRVQARTPQDGAALPQDGVVCDPVNSPPACHPALSTTARDVQDRAPVPAHRMAWALGQAVPDLPVEPVLLPLLHGDVAGERAEQRDVALRVVDPLPVEVPDSRHLEQPARLDLGALLPQFARAGGTLSGRLPFTDLVVDLLNLAEERVAATGKHVQGAPEREVTARAEHLPGAAVADSRIDPVPGGRRVDQVKPLARAGLPLLEPPLDDLSVQAGQIPACGGGQLRAELDAGNPETAPGQRDGGLAGSAAQLQQVVAPGQPGDGDELVEELSRVVRADLLVAPRRLVERLPEPQAVLVRRHGPSLSVMPGARQPSASQPSASQPGAGQPSESYADPRLAALYDALNPADASTAFYLSLPGAPPARILDVGCGTGLLACEFAARGYDVTGADPAAAMLATARARPGGDQVRWVQASAAGLDPGLGLDA